MQESHGFSQNSGHGSPEREREANSSSLQFKKKALPGFPLLDPETVLPSKDELCMQIEPFLKP